MKNLILILAICSLYIPRVAFACEVCEKNQPAALRGLTHGQGPQGKWDFVIIIIAAVIVLFTLYYSIRFLVRPKENDKAHIKNIVVEK